MSNVEYFYAAHSAYVYLGSAKFMEIMASAGRGIIPFGSRGGVHYAES